MDKQLITDIKVARMIIESEVCFDFDNIDLKRYQPIYLFSNENIKGITNNISFFEKEVLTVCSSGDQIFNMLLAGAKVVDSFDINIFTKYFYYLKEAAILTLSYKEFLEFFISSKMLKKNKVFSKKLFSKIKNNIRNKESRIFWDYLFDIYDGKNIYYSNLFILNGYSKNNYIECNSYLNNEDNYNKLKEYLLSYQLSFNRIDISLDVSQKSLDKKYDIIYLSNILDTLEVANEIKYVKKIKEIVLNFKKNLYKDGIIGVCYLFCYLDDYWYESDRSNLKSKIIRDTYFDDDYSYHEFGSIFDINGSVLKNRDALMLVKKK